MAEYTSDVSKYYSNTPHLREYGFTIQERGYTFQFKTNYGKYVKWADRTKRSVTRQARKLLNYWANFIALEAKKRCPHYSGALARAIKVSDTHLLSKADFGESRMSVGVGVDGRSWKSAYDSIVEHMIEKGMEPVNPAMSSPSLVIFLHEYWNQVAGDLARRRAEIKAERVGLDSYVGDHFLTRARTENEAEIKQQIDKLFKKPLQIMAKSMKNTNVADTMSDTALEEMVAANELFDYAEDDIPF